MHIVGMNKARYTSVMRERCERLNRYAWQDNEFLS
jgi:hypothetical protein